MKFDFKKNWIFYGIAFLIFVAVPGGFVISALYAKRKLKETAELEAKKNAKYFENADGSIDYSKYKDGTFVPLT